MRRRVGGGGGGRDADPVAHDVVGVRVAPVLVVGRQHVRAELADQPDQRQRRLVDVHQPEAALGQRRQRVALRQAGVHPAEPHLGDAEDLPRPVHLLAPDAGDVGQHVRAVHGRVEDRAALAARAGGDDDVHALGDVARGGRRPLAGLVVGVGVHVQQTESLAGRVHAERGWGHAAHAATGARERRPRHRRPRPRPARALRRAGHDGSVTDAAARLARRYPPPRVPRGVLVGLVAAGTAAGSDVAGVGGAGARQPRGQRGRLGLPRRLRHPDHGDDDGAALRPAGARPCRLIAQSPDFQPVAEQEVEVPSGDVALADVQVDLTTLRRATSAKVSGCESRLTSLTAGGPAVRLAGCLTPRPTPSG